MFWRRRNHSDFSSEIQAHIELETDRLVADGWSPDAARDAAKRAFGNVVAAKERFYEASRWIWLEQLVQDLRYAWRGLRHSPGFVATTVLTLAVGLGLVTVAFTIFNAYVLRPFAVRDPSSLYTIAWRSQEDGGQQFRWRDYEALRERADLFDGVIADHTRYLSSNRRTLAASFVSENYFETLRPALLLGRALERSDARASVVVLSHPAWTRLFAADPEALGGALELNGRPFIVVGVLGPEFTGLDDYPRDLWLPIATDGAVARPGLFGPTQTPQVEIAARLRAGVTVEHARNALTPFMARMSDTPGVRAEVWSRATPNPLSLELLAIVSPVFAAFALVLITACANVSNVMLARAIARHREIAVRLSLGASRGRVIRQLLTEGLVIALLAGVAGLAVAAWTLRTATVALFSTLPPAMAALMRVAPLHFDRRVFLFALGIAAVTTLMFALLPALQASRLSLTDALRGQRSGSLRGSRLRSALVIGQVAVSLVLVIVALTLGRNGAAVGGIDLGYETKGVDSINVRGEEHDRVSRLATVLAAEPGVAEVAVTGGNPLFVRSRAVAAAARADALAQRTAAVATRYTFVSPEYFSILRIPIERGRGFRADEARSDARVTIVSAATAKAFWPNEDPIGRTVRIERPEGRPVEELPGYSEVVVVGVVRDVVSGMMIDGHDEGHLYFPTTAAGAHAVALLTRARPGSDLGPETRERLFKQVDPDPEVFEVMPLDQMRAIQMYPMLAASWVGSLLGAIALALSVSGLYGVLAYTLSQRTKEIGIRMALGATAGAVMRLVIGQSARLAAIGAAIGLIVAFGVLSMLNAAIQLRNVALVDIVAFGAGLALVMAATALAAYHPARRATRVEPAQTLRADA